MCSQNGVIDEGNREDTKTNTKETKQNEKGKTKVVRNQHDL